MTHDNGGKRFARMLRIWTAWRKPGSISSEGAM